jgi:peptidyl-prolyl cis-trans isomerase C
MRISLAAALLACCSFTAVADVPGDPVLISQNGSSVSVSDVDAFLARVPAGDRAGLMDSPDRTEQLLTNLLRSKQLAKQARELKLDQSAPVQRQIMIADDEVLARVRLDEYAKTIKVPDVSELAHEEYLAHKADYVIPESVEVQHLLITTRERGDEAAKALAEKMRQQALANPAGFEDLVMQYSEDASKGGNKGLVKNATGTGYVVEFKAAAKALHAKGEISPVVKTRFGYHILKLIDSTPAQDIPFDKVKDKLVAQLRQQSIDKQKKVFLDGLDAAKADVNADAIDTLRTRYVAPGQLTPADAANAPAKAGARDGAAEKTPAGDPAKH